MKKPYRSPLIYNLIKEYKTLSKTFYEKKKNIKGRHDHKASSAEDTGRNTVVQ